MHGMHVLLALAKECTALWSSLCAVSGLLMCVCGCMGSSQLMYWLTQLYLVSLGCLLYTIYISTCNTSNVCQSTAMIRFDSDKYIRKIARKPQSHDSWYMMNNMIFTIYDNSSSNQSETNSNYNCCTRTFNSCCENVVFTSTDQPRQSAFNNIGRCRLHVYFQQKCMYLHPIIARNLKNDSQISKKKKRVIECNTIPVRFMSACRTIHLFY